MIWIVRLLAIGLIIVATAHALEESPTLVKAPQDVARRLALALPAATAPHVVAVDAVIYEARVTTCPRPLTIAVVPPSFTPRAALFDLSAAGDRIFYAYLDWFGARPDRRAVFWRRVRQPLLASVGLNPYGRLREMLVVAEPLGCTIAETANWRRYWTKP